MALHAFVAMPFDKKEGIDFNKVYNEYIKPALESEGFEAFRADEETRAGNIRTDTFQELLLADLVVENGDVGFKANCFTPPSTLLHQRARIIIDQGSGDSQVSSNCSMLRETL